MKPWILGLTGGIGSGKSVAARHFETLGILQVDADLIARQVVEPGQPALDLIKKHFGEFILNEHGQLNRAKLRSLVFDNTSERLWLEALLHPLIREEISRQLDAIQAPYAILTAPLLIESDNLRNKVHRILVIDTPEEIQIARTIQRDDISEAQARAILASQISREKRRSHAHDIISNDRDLNWLHTEIERLHHHYLTLKS